MPDPESPSVALEFLSPRESLPDVLAGSLPAAGHVLPPRGPWAYDTFGRDIVRRADEHGDDSALAAIQNAFPRVSPEDAVLWLSYMKASRGRPLDPCIMNTFRTTSYVRALREGNAAELFPELALLLPAVRTLRDSPQAAHRIAHLRRTGGVNAAATTHPPSPRVPVETDMPVAAQLSPQPSSHASSHAQTTLPAQSNVVRITRNGLGAEAHASSSLVNIFIGPVTIHNITINR